MAKNKPAEETSHETLDEETVPQASAPRPTIGRIVHVVADEHGRMRPAIVTNVVADSMLIDVTAFTVPDLDTPAGSPAPIPTTKPMRSLPYEEGAQTPDTWHWPARA